MDGRSDLDIVCPVRVGNKNDELRHALRSWHLNLPHRNVHLWGAPPAWTKNVIKHPMQQSQSNYRLNTTKMMQAACQDPNISNPFIWLNDDIFVMKPVEEVERLNRGFIDDVIVNHPNSKHNYAQGMIATKNLLIDEGFDEAGILSYELHMPLLVFKTTMLYALRVYTDSRRPNLHKRTLYGNIAEYGGRTVPDNKIVDVSRQWDKDCTYISTSDTSFARHPVGRWIREKLDAAGPYEHPLPHPLICH